MENIDTILIFDKVSALYKNGVGIFDISFSLNSGDFLFIMGPTGSGKSTILRSIYLDIDIKKGKIFYKILRLKGQIWQIIKARFMIEI